VRLIALSVAAAVHSDHLVAIRKRLLRFAKGCICAGLAGFKLQGDGLYNVFLRCEDLG
jgi:hypothetical protein